MGGFKCVKQIKYYTVRDSIMITTSLCGGYFLQSLLEWSGPDQHVGIACCTRLVPRSGPDQHVGIASVLVLFLGLGQINMWG